MFFLNLNLKCKKKIFIRLFFFFTFYSLNSKTGDTVHIFIHVTCRDISLFTFFDFFYFDYFFNNKRNLPLDATTIFPIYFGRFRRYIFSLSANNKVQHLKYDLLRLNGSCSEWRHVSTGSPFSRITRFVAHSGICTATFSSHFRNLFTDNWRQAAGLLMRMKRNLNLRQAAEIRFSWLFVLVFGHSLAELRLKEKAFSCKLHQFIWL